MSDKILQSIFEFTKKYKDPANNNPLDQKNSNPKNLQNFEFWPHVPLLLISFLSSV